MADNAIEADVSDLLALARHLADSAGTVQRDLIQPASEELGGYALNQVKTNTPVVSGRLRADMGLDVQPPQGAVIHTVITNPQPYTQWIETGQRNDPRAGLVTMKVRPGGYRMIEKGLAAAMARVDVIFNGHLNRWLQKLFG